MSFNFFKKHSLKKIILFGLLFIVASGLGAAIFERLVLPQLRVIPFFRNISFFDSGSPIVITRREEIRIENSVNTQELINRTRGALVKVYSSQAGKFSVTKPMRVLSGFVATNDGLILIPADSVKRGDDVTVVLASGAVHTGIVLFVDPVSGIGFVKITARDLPVLSEAQIRDKKPGEQLLALSLDEGQGTRANAVELLSADFASPSLIKIYDLMAFTADLDLDLNLAVEDLGSVIVDKDGALVGFVSQIRGAPAALRVDDVQLTLDNFLFHESLAVAWPQLRLGYLVLGPIEAELLGLPKQSGILVREAPRVAASQAAINLAVGDFVYEIDGRAISSENPFQSVLFAKKSGDTVRLKLLRNGLDVEMEISL